MSEMLDKDKLWFKYFINVGSIDDSEISDYLGSLRDELKRWFDESIQFVMIPFRGKSDEPSNVEVLYVPIGNDDENIKCLEEDERLPKTAEKATESLAP